VGVSEREPPEDSAPLVAGKYRLTRVLGRGGMGAVWEGMHATLGTRVAVKFIDPEYADSPEARNRFENEARAAAALRSKHVVEMYDHGLAEDGSPFIVMEYLEGEPLDRRLDRVGRLSPADTARILHQACRAVARAHAAGIVHRDLKPENLFLVWDDEEQSDFVKVLDFGIAKFTDRSIGASSATRTGSVLGTPFYMSPEQARGLRSVDHRTDVWSLGVIAYRCIVGTLPFDGEAIGDLLVRLCTEPIPVPSRVVPDVPPGFDAFIERALSRDLDKRFQSVQELADALARACGVASRSVLASQDLSGPTPELPRVMPVPNDARKSHQAITAGALTQSADPTDVRRGRTPVWAVLALVALVVVGIGVGVVAKAFAERAETPEPSSSTLSAGAKPERVQITPVQDPVPAAVAPPPALDAPLPATTARPATSSISPRAPASARRAARPLPPKDAPAQASTKPAKRPIDLGY
jgi:serine/threonine-protein kinase